MAYTAVKLTDVQKAIAAVTAAQSKYTTAQNNTKTSQTAVTNAQKTLNDAQAKLDKLQASFDDGSYLSKNTAYQNALKAVKTAEAAAEKAYNGMFVDDYKKAKAAEATYGKAVTAVDKAYAAVETARANAEKAYQNGTIKPAQTAYNTANKTFETAQNKYQGLMDSIQPILDQRNEAINNVGNYINDIKGSLGDVTKFADAKSVQTLLGQIQTAVNNTKLTDLINPVKSMISEIDPLKMANIPKVNLPNANPDYFSNIDPNTGIPMLDQGALDSVLDKYKSNSLTANQYRDNYDKFGWNVKSDGSSVARGAAIFGLEKTNVPMGGGVSYTGDFNKAAQQAGIDISGLKTNEEKYNAINEATKDFYVVANALDRTGASANEKAPHAAILFKADGSGNLVPVTKPDGKLAANYFDAVGVSHAGWRGQLAELAPVIQIASMAFLPGLGQALGSQIASTAAGQVIGSAASNAIANAAIGAGMAAITGGDIGKAALTSGIGSFAAQNATQIANKVVGAENIKAIADAANLTRGQVENIITNGISEALSSGLTDKSNILENVARTVAGSFASEQARNLTTRALLDADQDVLSRAADAAANFANLGTQAAIAGKNPLEVMAAAAPSIIASTSGVPVEERAGIEDRSTQFNKDVAFVKETYGLSDSDASAMVRSLYGNIPSEQLGSAFAGVGVSAAGSLDKPLGKIYSGKKGDLNVMTEYEDAQNPVEAQLYERTLPDGSKINYLQVYDKVKDKIISFLPRQFEAEGNVGTTFIPTSTIPTEMSSDIAFSANLSQPPSFLKTTGISPTEQSRRIEALKNVAITGNPEELEYLQKEATKFGSLPQQFESPDVFKSDFSKYQSQATNLYKQAGIYPTSSQVNNLAANLMSNVVFNSSSQVPGTSQVSGTSQVPGTGEVLGGLQGGAGAGGVGTGGAGTGGIGTGDTGVGEEGTGEEGTEELAQKQSALQQYQQYMNKLKAQQQGALQDINKQSVYYLTPEEQEARGYFNPATLFESVTPFKRGGLASIKRNAKWQ